MKLSINRKALGYFTSQLQTVTHKSTSHNVLDPKGATGTHMTSSVRKKNSCSA